MYHFTGSSELAFYWIIQTTFFLAVRHTEIEMLLQLLNMLLKAIKTQKAWLDTTTILILIWHFYEKGGNLDPCVYMESKMVVSSAAHINKAALLICQFSILLLVLLISNCPTPQWISKADFRKY